MPEFKVTFSLKLIHIWPINLMLLGTLGMGRNLIEGLAGTRSHASKCYFLLFDLIYADTPF